MAVLEITTRVVVIGGGRRQQTRLPLVVGRGRGIAIAAGRRIGLTLDHRRRQSDGVSTLKGTVITLPIRDLVGVKLDQLIDNGKEPGHRDRIV